MSEENKINKLNEPPAEYQALRIQFYTSFEEAEKSTLLEQLAFTPEQRLANACLLIKNIYSKEIKENKRFGTRIYFDNPSEHF